MHGRDLGKLRRKESHKTGKVSSPDSLERLRHALKEKRNVLRESERMHPSHWYYVQPTQMKKGLSSSSGGIQNMVKKAHTSAGIAHPGKNSAIGRTLFPNAWVKKSQATRQY